MKSFKDKAIYYLKFHYPMFFSKLLGELPLVPAKKITAAAEFKWSGAIPNNVYQTWIGNWFGRTHAEQIDRFRNMNPDFNFIFYTDEQRDLYMEEFYANHPIIDVYRNTLPGAMKVDIWRYSILCERGGLYFDINKCLTVPIREVLHSDDVALISYEGNLLSDVRPKDPRVIIPWQFPEAAQGILDYDDRPILNWGLAFTKNHPFLVRTLDNIVKHAPHFKGKVFERARDPIIELTTYMLTRSIYECVAENPVVAFRQCGVDFNGFGDANIPGSWVRYATRPSYVHTTNNIILK